MPNVLSLRVTRAGESERLSCFPDEMLLTSTPSACSRQGSRSQGGRARAVRFYGAHISEHGLRARVPC